MVVPVGMAVRPGWLAAAGPAARPGRRVWPPTVLTVVSARTAGTVMTLTLMLTAPMAATVVPVALVVLVGMLVSGRM
jgi:hypothetical protein